MNDPGHILSPDTQATLLLCGIFGKDDAEMKPLTTAPYNRLADWLRQQGLRPGDLLNSEGRRRLEQAGDEAPDTQTILRLLGRGAALALAVERWSNQGLWVISRGDERYPRQMKSKMARQAPPILYGAGNADLLGREGLSIVGSRDADQKALQFTRNLARWCAASGITVISGGAKGIDETAMLAAIDAGGAVIGVLADGLERETVSRKYREALRRGRLVLISPYWPGARFSAGAAMGRNRLIYTLAEAALVVSSSFEQGGTWNGAVEDLKHRWTPMLVRDDADAPEGNHRLIELGAIALTTCVDRSDDDEIASLRLGGIAAEWQRRTEMLETAPLNTAVIDAPATDLYGAKAKKKRAARAKREPEASLPDLSEAFWNEQIRPTLERLLVLPATEKAVASALGVELKQAKLWLGRAVDEGMVIKAGRPARYELNKQPTLIPVD
ncbi:MAG: DNA-protecting protein DprA [Acidobacteria bacterium]|nr:DNA-protecting protein DprA [Acidobacteriota bacterium]